MVGWMEGIADVPYSSVPIKGQGVMFFVRASSLHRIKKIRAQKTKSCIGIRLFERCQTTQWKGKYLDKK